MKHIYRLFLSLLFLCGVAHAQTPEWVQQSVSNASSDSVEFRDLCSDGNGNVYITGGFEGTVDFGANTLVSNGNLDIFVVKYDNAGNVIWAKSFGGSDEERGFGITLDKWNNIYITGGFSGNSIPEFGTASDGIDVFLLKLDASGNIKWAGTAFTNPTFEGKSDDKGRDVACDKWGNVYIVGHLQDSVSGNFGASSVSGFGQMDYFVAKYDSAGTVKWVNRGGGTKKVGATGVSVDTLGNIYITGSYKGLNCSFEGTLKTSQSLFGNYLDDIFVLKYDSLGVNKYVTTGNMVGNSVRISTESNGNSYITGAFVGQAIFGNDTLINSFGNLLDPNFAAFTAKINPSGKFTWARQSVNNGKTVGTDIYLDKNINKLYVSGGYGFFNTNSNPAYFETDSLALHSPLDGFFVSYDTSGTFYWSQKVVNAYGISALANFDRGAGALGITADNNGNVFIGGTFGQIGSQLYFDSCTIYSPANGKTASYVSKLIPNSITIDPLSSLSVCEGSSLTVKYTIQNAMCFSGRFYVQFSDSAGNFQRFTNVLFPVNPTQLADSVTIVVPVLPYGTKYRIRIISENPHFVGTNNGQDITVYPVLAKPNSIIGSSSVTSGQTGVIYSVDTVSGATGYNWTLPTGATIVSGAGTDSITVDFSSGAASGYISVSPTGICGIGPSSDLFFIGVKTNTNGLPDNNSNTFYQWTKSSGYPTDVRSFDIANDVQGNSYVIGKIIWMNGNYDIMFSKYDPKGNLLGQSILNGPDGDDEGHGITIDNSGNIFITGSFTGTVDFGGGNFFTSVDMSHPQAFIAKYDPAGTILWVRCLGTSGSALEDRGNSVIADSNGDILVTGFFGDFNGDVLYDEFLNPILTAHGIRDYFIIKLDQNGTILWADNGGGSDFLGGSSIAVDAAGNAYITGGFVGLAGGGTGTGYFGKLGDTTRVSFGQQDAFILKYDPAGNLQWVKQGNSYFAGGYDITVDDNGDIYTVGAFYDTLKFPGSPLLLSPVADVLYPDNVNYFIVKYDASGGFLWARQSYSGRAVSTDYHQALAYGVRTDNSGNVFANGYFDKKTVFSSDSIDVSDYADNSSFGDNFIIKFSSSGVFDWVKQDSATITNYDPMDPSKSARNTPLALSIDSTGNLFHCGYILNGGAYFDCSQVSASAGAEMFVSKLKPTLLTTLPVNPLAYCDGDSITISFTSTDTLCSGNYFVAVLSDTLGNFTNITRLDSLISDKSGIMKVKVPGSVLVGTQYRVRVESTSPRLISSDNGSDITINHYPDSSAAITGTAIVCQGDTGVQYSVPSIPGATGYTWTLPSGATISGNSDTNVVKVNFSLAALNGNIFVQGTNLCGNGDTSALFPVLVNTMPAAPTVGGQTICSGNTATLTATAPGGTYQWYDASTAGNLEFTGNPLTTSVLNADTTLYVQTTVSGCTSSRTVVTVTVTPTPAAPTVAGSGICSGTAAILNATAPGGTYEWYDAPSGGNLGYTGTPVTTSVLNADTTYYVQATINLCTSTRTAVTVTVTPTPASPTAADQSICSGKTATLTATAPGGNYEWYDAVSGGSLQGAGAVFVTPSLSVDTAYYVETSISGCTGPRTKVDVTVNPAPVTPTITVTGATTFCKGDSVILTSSSATNNLWNTGSAAQSITVKTSGNYYVVVSNTFSCKDSSLVETLNEMIITLTLTSPTYDGTNNISSNQGNDGSIDLTASGGTSPYTYSWSNGEITEDIAQLIAGSYTVSVSDNMGCSETSSITLIEPSADVVLPNGFSPNGDGRNDTYKISGLQSFKDNSLVVFNRWGNEVFAVTNYNNEWDGHSSGGDELPDGTYFVVFKGKSNDKVTEKSEYVIIKR